MRDISGIIYRPALHSEWSACVDLALRTFMRFEAPAYTPEGVTSFHEFIKDETLEKMFINGAYKVIVAELDGLIVGMISLRDGEHISLLFVDEEYHRLGIGTGLISAMTDYMTAEAPLDHLTVNAAPYGYGFYHRLGFVDTDEEKMTDGITYTPMILEI